VRLFESRQRVSGIPAEIALHIFDVVMTRVSKPLWDAAETRRVLVEAIEDGFIEAGEAKRILRHDGRPQMISPSTIGMDRIVHRWNLHKTRLPVDAWPMGARPPKVVRPVAVTTPASHDDILVVNAHDVPRGGDRR